MSYLYSHKRKEEFWYNEDLHTCTCTITTNFGEFIGKAFCHPDDLDMKSQRTGEQIAYHRALIEMLKYERDCILIPQIKVLEHVQSILNSKKKIAESDLYAATTLKRQLTNLKFELQIIRDNIESERERLREYISKKEEMYQRIRAKQNKKQDSKNNI